MIYQKVLTGTILYTFLHLELIPQGYLICNGLEYSKTEFSELYNIIKNKYGEASNIDNFKVPNLLFRYIKGTINNDSGTIEHSAILKHNHPKILTELSGAHSHTYYIHSPTRYGHRGTHGSTPKHYARVLYTEITKKDGEHTHDVTIVPQGTRTGSLNSYVMVPLIKY